MFHYHKHKSNKTSAPESPCEGELHMQENIYLIASLRSTVWDKDCVSHLPLFILKKVNDRWLKEYYFAY